MIWNKITPLLLILALLPACSSNGGNDGETFGTAAGAVIGGVIGSKMGSGDGKVLSGGLGAVFGAWLGRVAGRKLDEMDQQRANDSARDTMESADSGETNVWSNPDSGNSGTYTPTSGGGECRNFESTVIIDGKEEAASGRACRQSDGTWKIIE